MLTERKKLELKEGMRTLSFPEGLQVSFSSQSYWKVIINGTLISRKEDTSVGT